MANSSRRVNDSLTVQEFANRFTIISEEDVQAMREGEERVVETTFGWVDQTSANPEYAYLNLIGEDDLSHLNELAYENEQGELVVDYDDLSDSPIKDCTMSRSVIGPFPSGVRTNKNVRAVVSISEDEDGVEWINVMEILELQNPTEATEKKFSPSNVEQGAVAQ